MVQGRRAALWLADPSGPPAGAVARDASRLPGVGHASQPELVVLHAVRVRGMADVDRLAGRTGLDRRVVEEQLLDDESRGWVRRVEFADLSGWTLTESGRAEGERRLAEELDGAGARLVVDRAHATFTRLNERFLGSLTRWQIRPQPWDAMAANDHADHRWDDRVLDELASYGRRLGPVCADLTDALERFAGYDERYARALTRVARGESSWVDGTGIDSCHTVWIELHEDLLATLRLERGRAG